MNKQKINLLLCSIFLLLLINFSLANFSESEESIAAKSNLNLANDSIQEMNQREIPTKRVQEIYEEANQLYASKILLEMDGRSANYDLVNKYCSQILEISEIALITKDEFIIFNDEYVIAKEESDLTEFEEEYVKINNSFYEERFEDTRNLIKEGYITISRIQSEQTKARAFYLSTTKTLENFFKENWEKLLIILFSAMIIGLIIRKSLTIYFLKRKLKYLDLQEQSLKRLIKLAQKEYFRTKNISSLEYNIKINKYESMIRDISRQRMVIREELYKRKNAKEIEKGIQKEKPEEEKSKKQISKSQILKKQPDQKNEEEKIKEESSKKKTNRNKISKKQIIKNKKTNKKISNKKK